MTNIVKYGLRNVHYAKYEKVEDEILFDTPKRLPGAVELSLEPQGDPIEKYADDGLYYRAANNQGYEGTLTIALIPEEFSVEVLGLVKNSDNVLIETAEAKGESFALMFEFDGDVKATRYVLYNCSASRPTVESVTKDDGTETQDDELEFKASLHPVTRIVKASTSSETTPEIYNNWYKTVYEFVEEVVEPVE